MAKPFNVTIQVAGWGNGLPQPAREMEVLVDTSAAYTSLPQKILKKLKVPVRGKMVLRLADGSLIERDYGPCEIYVVNRWVGTTVLFSKDEDLPLLGTNTMDDASVGVNIHKKRLVPVEAIQA